MGPKRKLTKRTTGARKRRAARKRIVMYLIVLVMLVICASILYILNQSQFRFESVVVTNAVAVDESELTSLIDEYTAGSHYLVLPRDSIFWYPKHEIESAILSRYPEVYSVDISLEEFDVLVVDILERQSLRYVETKEGVYEVDIDGVIFRTLDTEHLTEGHHVYSMHQYDETPLMVGELVVEAETLAGLDGLVSELEKVGIDIVRVRLENDILAILETAHGARFVVYPDTDYSSVAETLKGIIQYKEFAFDKQSGTFREPVEYINFRHGSKLFYCYTGEECQTNYLIN